MALAFAMVYLGGWVVTTAAAYAAARRLTDHDTTSQQVLCISVLAGVVWPMLLLGAVEFSSLAVFSTANSMRSEPIPDSWLDEGVARDDRNTVVPLH